MFNCIPHALKLFRVFQILYSLESAKKFSQKFLDYGIHLYMKWCGNYVMAQELVEYLGMSNKECCSDLYVMLFHSPIDGSDVICSSFLAVDSS